MTRDLLPITLLCGKTATIGNATMRCENYASHLGDCWYNVAIVTTCAPCAGSGEGLNGYCSECLGTGHTWPRRPPFSAREDV